MQTAERLREARQRRNSTLMALLVALVSLIAFFLFINSPYFIIGTVSINGNKYIPVEESYVLPAFPGKSISLGSGRMISMTG